MIIGLAGKAQSGKDEFARVAVEEFGAERIAFADALKEEVAAFLDKHNVCWEHRHLWGDGKDKEAILRMSHYDRPKRGVLSKFLTAYGEYSHGYYYFTSRSLLQFWGTEYRRNQDPDYWVHRVADKTTDPSKLYVISDCRFENEVTYICSKNGKIVEIIRPSRMDISNPTHASERGFSEFSTYHYQINNFGTLDVYHAQVRGILKEIVDGQQ